MSSRNWVLSPSDFAFLWEDCKRCFYLKVVKNFRRPSAPMPKIFNVIDGLMKTFFQAKRTEEMMAFLPRGVVQPGDNENWVQSNPMHFPGYLSTCVLRGKLDTVVKFDDGTYAVIDFKTSRTNEGHLPVYARQLHAYAYALENAAPGNLALRPIRKLGLLVFEPDCFLGGGDRAASLSGVLTWKEIPRDDGAFLGFLEEVMRLLDQSEPPRGAAACEWCMYRGAARRTGF